MSRPMIKTIAVFTRPFTIEGFEETLPAGEYEFETVLPSPHSHRPTEDWANSVRVMLHSRTSHPGLARSLTVPLAAFARAQAKDKLTGHDIVDVFIEEMLADPLIRLMMDADRVSSQDIRQIYSGAPDTEPDKEIGALSDRPVAVPRLRLDREAILSAENEGMPIRARPRL